VRRRTFLGAIPAAALLCVRCGDGNDGATVRLTLPSPTPANAGPTPTSLPAPEVMLSTDTLPQGGATLLSLIGQVGGGSATFLSRTYPLTQGSRSIYAFMGVGTDDQTGQQDLKIEFTLANGSKGSLTESLVVTPTTWTTDSVTLPANLAALLAPGVADVEVRFLTDIYSKVTPEKLWKSEAGWSVPVGGPITTYFGEQRSYNGGPITGHHAGADIGAPEGTPVAATNSGRVVLARQLLQRGNMVVVDHGGGLYSGYAHLSQFSVAEGEAVDAGQTVGRVGTTGLSTGAHLHWEMAVGGITVDALRFANGANGF
jgi:murein DD-endopeptidase MepM/ murein hydrolase activator NlpD